MSSDLAGAVATSTTFDLPGHTVERTLGLSWGLIVRSVGLTKGLTGSLKSLRAGEVREFTDVGRPGSAHGAGAADGACAGPRRERRARGAVRLLRPRQRAGRDRRLRHRRD